MRDGYEWLYRPNIYDSWGTYYVTITQPGPRGGKRPPLIKAYLRAEDYNDAVAHVEQTFLNRTRCEVRAG